jgi:sugar lactone lactonase YvrE
MIFTFFVLILLCFVHFAQSDDSCNLKLKYSVSLTDSSGTPIAIESAEMDEKRNAILLSTRSTNQVIRIDSNNGNILNMPYIDNIERARASAVIGDLFFIASANSIRIYDMDEDNFDAPEYVADIYPENTLTTHQYNGLCVTGDNKFLYVTDPGFVFGSGAAAGPSQTGGVWKIDLSDYSSQEVVELGTRIQPNGCIVDNDGNLLFGARGDASTNPATATSVMYIWDELNDEIKLLKLNGLTLGMEGGSVDVDDNLFITENKIGKEIFAVNLNEFVPCVLYHKPNFCDPDQEYELNKIDISLDNPADTGYNAKKNYLLVPSMNTESVENFAVYKIC